MKKKKSKYSAVKAFEVVNVLKANVELLHEKGKDTAFIKALEASIRKTERTNKELVALKERLNTKKSIFEQEKVLTQELVKNAKEVLKKELGKKVKHEKKKKSEKEEEKQNTEVAIEAEEPK